jgi:hypothetical protein
MRSAKERLAILAASSALATLLLAGCGSAPVLPPTPAPTTSAPVFASEDEALAAATEAYAAYLEVSDAVSNDGGFEAERYGTVASGQALTDASKSAQQFVDAGAHSIGSTVFVVHKLQAWGDDPEVGTYASLYICDDVSAVDVVGADGHSIVSHNRPAKTPFEVTVMCLSSREIYVVSKEVWMGANFC